MTSDNLSQAPQITRASVWDKSYLSYRRLLLDIWLSHVQALMTGRVVDLGGKRINKRGAFRPPEEQAKEWVYLNLDLGTKPHLQANVSHVPLTNECADCIILTETIEHLRDPAGCIAETIRILKSGGILIVSVPFLYPVHADPHDFQRYTADGLRELCRGFSKVEVAGMGRMWGVLGMFMELHAEKMAPSIWRALLWRMGRNLVWLDARSGLDKLGQSARFTTGYFAVCTK